MTEARLFKLKRLVSAGAGRPGGFTLIEVLISLVLVMMLVMGISSIYKSTSDIVLAGNALLKMSRDGQASQWIITSDARSAIQTSPLIFVDSRQYFRYLDGNDRATEVDNNVQTLDDVPGGRLVAATETNRRSHRADKLGLFTTGDVPAVMADGTSPSLVSPSRSAWALTVIEHGKLYQNGSVTADPDTADSPATNTYNLAANWALIRRRLLLQGPANAKTLASGNLATLTAFDVQDFWDSRRDIATNTSIPLIREDLRKAADADITLWTIGSGNKPVANPGLKIPKLWEQRYAAERLLSLPVSADNLARLSPVFVEHCSQFVVEFCGDFLTQDPASGVVTKAVPDGDTDYVFVQGAYAPTRVTRWYGLSRDTNYDGVITTSSTGTDVRPVSLVANMGIQQTPFELERTNTRYTCVWHDRTGSRPSGFRLVFKTEDPTGRLPAGMWHEVILGLTK